MRYGAALFVALNDMFVLLQLLSVATVNSLSVLLVEVSIDIRIFSFTQTVFVLMYRLYGLLSLFSFVTSRLNAAFSASAMIFSSSSYLSGIASNL